jgi:hypothetical protein
MLGYHFWAGALLTAGVILGFSIGANRMPSVLPACPTEDSDNCHWNAKARGNGTGESFVVLRGRVYYLAD